MYLILSDKNGETYRSETFSVKKSSSQNVYEGCEFAFVNNSENRRAYFADSRVISAPETVLAANAAGVYIHKERPLLVTYKNSAEALTAQYESGFLGRANDPTYSCIQWVALIDIDSRQNELLSEYGN